MFSKFFYTFFGQHVRFIERTGDWRNEKGMQK